MQRALQAQPQIRPYSDLGEIRSNAYSFYGRTCASICAFSCIARCMILAFWDLFCGRTMAWYYCDYSPHRPPHCLTAARGRGKSACLGLAVSAAVALGYVNIYVTSPHPENLITLFEFVLKGLDACLYQEHIDYNIVRSTNPDFKKAIVRINIARNSRQTVQVCFWINLGYWKLSQVL